MYLNNFCHHECSLLNSLKFPKKLPPNFFLIARASFRKPLISCNVDDFDEKLLIFCAQWTVL